MFTKINSLLTFEIFKKFVPIGEQIYIFNNDFTIYDIVCFSNNHESYYLDSLMVLDNTNGFNISTFNLAYKGKEFMLESDFKKLPILKIIREIQS